MAPLALSCRDAAAQPRARDLAGGAVEARSGADLVGTVTVKRRRDELKLFLNVLRAPPGSYAVRLHDTADCSANDANSAGAPLRDGDLGRLEVDVAGRGLLAVSNATLRLGDGTERDVVGKSLVIHRDRDGLGGTRIGCGVIR